MEVVRAQGQTEGVQVASVCVSFLLGVALGAFLDRRVGLTPTILLGVLLIVVVLWAWLRMSDRL